MNKKIIFFDAKPYDQEYFDQANKNFGFEIQYFNSHLNQETARFAEGYNVICAFVNDKISKEVIDKIKSYDVNLIALRSAGYNNVDLKAAFKNIHVVRVPSYSPHAVAEHAVALIMALNRKTHKAYFRTRDGNFSINGLIGFDMHNKTAGIIGLGRIGKCLVSILKGFGMKILAYEKSPDEVYGKESGIKFVTLDELYADSDVISLHCPLNKETFHMINEGTISKMKQGVMIINTGRGELIKTDALIAGLKSNKIGSAGLDVYEEEAEYFFEDFSNTMINDDVLARLLTFSNVIITSHQGFFTVEALRNIANTTLQNIKDFYDNKFLENEICYQCGANPSQCLKKQKKRCF